MKRLRIAFLAINGLGILFGLFMMWTAGEGPLFSIVQALVFVYWYNYTPWEKQNE